MGGWVGGIVRCNRTRRELRLGVGREFLFYFIFLYI